MMVTKGWRTCLMMETGGVGSLFPGEGKAWGDDATLLQY